MLHEVRKKLSLFWTTEQYFTGGRFFHTKMTKKNGDDSDESDDEINDDPNNTYHLWLAPESEDFLNL